MLVDMEEKEARRKRWSGSLTAALGDVDVDPELGHGAAGEAGHAAVGGLVAELHVHDLQTAGAGGHVRVASQEDEAFRGGDGRRVLVPGVVDLVLGLGVHVAGQLEVTADLDGLAVLVEVGRDLEGQVPHDCGETEERLVGA